MGAFHGKLNPLSGRAIYETCVIPVLLYGSENWFLTDALLQKLESFQAEIGRRILTLSRFHSARAVRLALDWPSVASRVLERKLLFLLRMCSNENVISHHFLTKLNCSDSSASPLQLLEGCVFLESYLGLEGLTGKVESLEIGCRGVRRVICNRDRDELQSEALKHKSTILASKVATSTSWLKLWDVALDLGPSGTLAIQSLYREMTRPAFGPSPCPRCPISDIDVLFDHFVIHHSPFQSSNDFLTSLTAENPDLSVYVNFFKTLLL